MGTEKTRLRASVGSEAWAARGARSSWTFSNVVEVEKVDMGSRAHNFCEFSLVGRSEILRRWRRSYSKLGMVEDFRCHRRVSCAHARSNPCLVIWTYIRLWDFADVLCYLLYYPPHSHSSSLSFCPIHIPPTNKPPFNQTISPPISIYLSNITSHHLHPTYPSLDPTGPRPNWFPRWCHPGPSRIHGRL